LSTGRSTWYLQFQGSEFGPMSLEEIRVILKNGKLDGQIFAHQPGMDQWVPVEQIPELKEFHRKVEEKKEAEKPSGNRRVSRRQRLVATVRFELAAVNERMRVWHVGLCKDICDTGMLVLSKTPPGYPGSLLFFVLEPASKLPSISGTATIVRLLPDEGGFAVRFKDLDAKAKAALQLYVETDRAQGR
jgi:hypothetical protein